MLHGSTTVFVLFMPFEKQSIYLKSMENVMMNEVAIFMQFLVSTMRNRLPAGWQPGAILSCCHLLVVLSSFGCHAC